MNDFFVNKSLILKTIAKITFADTSRDNHFVKNFSALSSIGYFWVCTQPIQFKGNNSTC